MKKKYNPEKEKLDAYEQGIEDSITDEMVNRPLDPKRGAELRAAAENTFKNARANIRINEGDMLELRRLAEQSGIPYQTLITHVLHLHVTNQLVNIQEVKKMADAGVFDRRKTGT